MALQKLWQSQTTLDAAVDYDLITDIDSYGLEEGLQYYLAFPSSEYQNKPNFMAWLQVLLTPFNDVGNLLVNIHQYFDIATAEGKQLDLLGQLIGQGRTINFMPTDGSSPTLIDRDYRALLRATIVRNTWDGTLPSLYTAWSTIFPNGEISIKDNQDMTMTVSLAGTFTTTQQDLIRHDYIVPRPAGVLVNGVLVNSVPGSVPTIVFGYDTETPYVDGWDIGSWFVSNS